MKVILSAYTKSEDSTKADTNNKQHREQQQNDHLRMVSNKWLGAGFPGV